MVEFQYTIKDPIGIHARPAGEIVAVAKQYTSFVTLWKNDTDYDLKKLLSFMGSGLKKNDTVVIRCEGPDEKECVKAVKEAFKNNL